MKIAKIKGIEHFCAYFTANRIIDIEALKKILGKTLPEATISRSATSAKAGNKIYEDFFKIFGTILQIEDVGADKNGTSLLVTRVVIMAQKLGYKINFFGRVH